MANRLGTTGIDLFSRLMGLILAALAVDMMVNGLTELMPELAG